MQTSLLKRLDTLLSSDACTVAANWPKRRIISDSRMLIVRPGGLGDLVCADIALQEIGREARDFLWLIEKRSKPWATYRGLTHFCYDTGLIRTLRKISGRHALVINTEQLFGLAQAASLMARTRDGQLVSFETNRGARWSDESVPYDWDARHETISFAQLFASALRLPEVREVRGPRARMHPASAVPLVLIAGRQSQSRRVGLDAWVAQISQWHRDRPFEIACAPEDEAFANELMPRFGIATRFTGNFNALCERISRAEDFFTVDGGGVHVASWFGVPTRVIFTSGRDRKWAPLGEGSSIVRRYDLPCQPCTKFGQVPPCPNAFACLKVEELEAVAVQRGEI